MARRHESRARHPRHRRDRGIRGIRHRGIRPRGIRMRRTHDHRAHQHGGDQGGDREAPECRTPPRALGDEARDRRADDGAEGRAAEHDGDGPGQIAVGDEVGGVGVGRRPEQSDRERPDESAGDGDRVGGRQGRHRHRDRERDEAPDDDGAPVEVPGESHEREAADDHDRRPDRDEQARLRLAHAESGAHLGEHRGGNHLRGDHDERGAAEHEERRPGQSRRRSGGGVDDGIRGGGVVHTSTLNFDIDVNVKVLVETIPRRAGTP